jgi:hypothetical protein
MYKRNMKKAMAGIMAATLIITACSTGITANAASSSTTTSSTQSTPPGDPPSGGAGDTPPDGSTTGSAPSGEAPSGNPPSGDPPSGGMGGANTMTYDYSGTLSAALVADGTEATADQDTYSSTTASKSVALAKNAGTLTIQNATLQKSGDDTNADNCNFYGINSILLAVNSGSTAYVSDSTLNADSDGSNGIFATDSGTVYTNNTTIATTADNSRGLDATYDGTIVANAMTISTQGDHSASIATDRGGGNISVTNSTLSTAGSGSPLLYSTGNIQVDNVTGTASGSQLAGMEGLNTILIHNSSLTSTITDKTASDPIADGVIIYQSTSGDAESSTGEAATFQAVDSTLTSAITSGAMFYLTNTTANVLLSNTTLDFDSENVNLLTVQGNDSNGWGTAGSNGAMLTFTALGETLSGNVDVDTISSLDMYLLEGTTYTGAATISTNAVNTKPTDAPITMNIDGTSTWVVTADTTISKLNVASGAKIVDESGNTVTIIANGKTVVEGNSALTVTVTGTYLTTVTTDTANLISTDYMERTGFDNYYNTTTTFASNTSTQTATATDTQATTETQVATVTGTQTTTESNDKQQDTAEVVEAESDSNNILPIAVGGIIVLAVVGGVAVLARKRK